MAYTSAEIQGAVDKLVRSSIRRVFGALGNEETSLVFSDTRDAAASIYILFKNAPYYTTFLGTERLQDKIATQAELLQNLLDAVVNTDRRVSPITKLASLANASSALGALQGASAVRTDAFTDIEDVPAFQRFELNTQRWLDESGKNIKKNGQIVQTPQGARTEIPSLTSSIKTNQAEIVQLVTYLKDSIEDFSSLSLPSTLSSAIISNAQGVIDGWYETFEPLSAEERLAQTKEATLDVLAARAIVKKYASLTSPSAFARMSGVGAPYADSTHLATAASLDAELYGPYKILGAYVQDSDIANELDLTVDGAVNMNIQLQGSFPASLTTFIPEPYDIHNASTLSSGFITGSFAFGATVNVMGETIEITNVFPGTSINHVILTANGSAQAVLLAELNEIFSAIGMECSFVLGQFFRVQTVATGANAIVEATSGTFLATAGIPNLTQDAGTDEIANNRHFSIAITPNPPLPYGSLDFDFDIDSESAAQEIVDKINTENAALALPNRLPIVAETAFLNTRFNGQVNIAFVAANTANFSFLPFDTASSWTTLGVELLDKIEVLEGNNDGALYEVTNVTVTTLTATRLSGVATVTDPNPARVEVGPPNRFVRIRVGAVTDPGNTTNISDALDNNWALSFPELDDAVHECFLTLGIPLGGAAGTKVTSRRTTAEEIANSVNISTQAAVNRVARITAEATFVPTLYTGKGRSDPNTSLTYVLYKFRETATNVTVGPASVFTVSGAATAGVEVGDIIVLRETTTPLDVNAQGTITAVSDTEIEATMTTPIVAVTNVLIEVGPDLNLPNDCTLKIGEGGVNAGTHSVTQEGSTPVKAIPFEIALSRPVPVTSEPGFLPVISESDELGQYKTTFSSTVQTTATQVSASDASATTAFIQFFSSPSPVDAFGSTKYFKLPKNPNTIERGDTLELYETNYNTVSQSFEVVGLELSALLITLSPQIASNFGDISFDTVIPPPFARLRHQQDNTFTAFYDGCVSWLTNSENESAFFRNLDALINPLLVNQNPTAVEVNSTKIQIQQLLGIITEAGATAAGLPTSGSLEAIAKAYQVDPVSQVDELVGSFMERGADRAADVLLQGRFSTFFGLSQGGTSYAGDVLEKIRAVAASDLPISKLNRLEHAEDGIIVEGEDPDFEFDQSDIEGGGEEVDIPADFEKLWPSQSY